MSIDKTKQIKRLITLAEDPLSVSEELLSIEETQLSHEELISNHEERLVELENMPPAEKGESGYTPIKGVDYFDGEKGDKGDDYILTEDDKKEISGLIEVPIVEKVIERTEIIREQPIVTNEIKEVAVKDNANEIADKLNTLKEKVDIEVIKGLRKELSDHAINTEQKIRFIGGNVSGVRVGSNGTILMENTVKFINFIGAGVSVQVDGNGQANVTINGGGTGGSTPVAYDLSDQCNGSTTLFTVPSAFTTVLLVTLTGWPPNGTLRPTVDYTVPDNTHIQFTSEVSAPEAGTSLIILVV